MCAPFLPDDGGPIALAGDETAGDAPPFPIALPPGVTRFVGRADELAELRTPWTRAVDTSQRRLVLVGGDPGIGKSRLTAEFARDVYDKARQSCSAAATRRTSSCTSRSSRPSSST